jgi:ABC-type phosphate transport system substrate-binding protein
MRRRSIPLALGFVVAALLVRESRGEEARGYRLIVHRDLAVSSLPADHVSRIFLKKTTRWPDGAVVHPVDLLESSPVREEFSRHIHGRRTWAIKSYWQQMIFSGRGTPPPEVSTDQEVLAYVRTTPGAIGYVSASASVADVKVLGVVE